MFVDLELFILVSNNRRTLSRHERWAVKIARSHSVQTVRRRPQTAAISFPLPYKTIEGCLCQFNSLQCNTHRIDVCVMWAASDVGGRQVRFSYTCNRTMWRSSLFLEAFSPASLQLTFSVTAGVIVPTSHRLNSGYTIQPPTTARVEHWRLQLWQQPLTLSEYVRLKCQAIEKGSQMIAIVMKDLAPSPSPYNIMWLRVSFVSSNVNACE